MKKLTLYLLIFISLFSINTSFKKIETNSIINNFSTDTLLYPDEKHFKNIQQLTFGGDNAEAYFSFDGKYLIFQHKNAKEGVACDQMYIGKIPANAEEKFEYKMISSGKGRTTCGYFMKDGKHIIYASTFLGGDSCPPVPDRSKYGNKYIWPIYTSFDIFMTDLEGKIVKRLTDSPGYDAEATLSPDGETMIFTSVRDGDLDLYTMDLKTYKVKRITNTLGYDGGAWFSPDGKKIIWRASRPRTTEEIKEYKDLLKEGLVAPTHMEVWVANADGTGAKQITNYGQANWAPNFLPDSKRVIFCSNHEYKHGFPFNMYLTDINGNGLEKVSRDNGFDAFPMFSPDGKKIVFSSNRNSGDTRDINIFIADWAD
jgi:TolB protein